MAIKNIIAMGIGFTPGSVKFIPTYGFIASVVVIVPGPFCIEESDQYIAGMSTEDTYIAGSVTADTYISGAVESDHCV